MGGRRIYRGVYREGYIGGIPLSSMPEGSLLLSQHARKALFQAGFPLS